MAYIRKKSRFGLTLMEVILACAIGTIISLIISIVLIAGHRNWLSSFNRANKGVEVDSYTAAITFGSTGRMSNKVDYRVYAVDKNGKCTRALPPPGIPVAVVDGNAVEFRYWDVPFSAGLVDVTKTATAYRLFYLDGDRLMMDQGPYPPGGVDEATGARRTAGVTTQRLAENVINLKFSHTTKNAQGDGDGCIRMAAVFTDPNGNHTIFLKTATLMRNVWP